MQEQNPRFRDKFIGYVDILGWKSFVEQANAEVNDLNLQVLTRFLDKLGSHEKQRDFAIYGPTLCPSSKHIQRDLDFQLTQAYDSWWFQPKYHQLV